MFYAQFRVIIPYTNILNRHKVFKIFSNNVSDIIERKIQVIWKQYIYNHQVINKRAQRALGRSPEEKVKGQGEAIILL